MARTRKSRTVKVSGLAKAINEVLDEYSADLVNAYNELALAEAKKTADDLQKTSPKDTGEYAKGWTYRKTGTDAFGMDQYEVYNESKPGLTHVLEYGHPVRNTPDGPVLGRAAPKPHIAKAEQRMIRRMTKGVQALDPDNT